LVDKHTLSCLCTDAAASPYAKAFWQHTGLGASSRQAAIVLGREEAPSTDQGEQARRIVRQRLAAIHHCAEEHISLVPAGMAALHAGLEAVQTLRPGLPTLQLGFPYVDVLKQPQVVFHGSELLSSTELGDIAAALDRLEPSAVIVELPSNPLLRCVDLPAVAELAHARGIPLIADDTIGTGINIEALPYADLIFTSLTKSFAGRGNVMAGCLLISPNAQWTSILLNAVALRATLSDADAIALELNSRDVTDRVPRLDANCLALAQKLEKHPAVKRVLHPKDCKNFQAIKKPGAGDGCLLSFELHTGELNAQRVFDALQICKGPSLGTSFSMVCPYAQLAHYDELDWAEACGVPAHLLRVSVGLEEPDELWSRFQKALAHATDRPKV
jgi:cystathionine gamma-synthase